MNAMEKVQKYLNSEPCYYIPGYTIIDPMIKQLCELLTSHGYITVHSCSCHPGRKQWYVTFVATKRIEPIKNVVQRLNTQFGFEFDFRKDHYKQEGKSVLTRRWYFGTTKIKREDSFNDDYLENFNQIIYHEFIKEFNK